MTLDQFLESYRCNVDIQNPENVTLFIATEIIRRSDNHVMDTIKTKHDIGEVSQLIGDSQTMISLMPLDWIKVIDHTKRAHIDSFAQRIPIDDFYSLNNSDNPDITHMYI
jgi:hypothetical protein